ncbi:Ribonuclease H-like domain-containing protein [Cynara cardunculus var. scolymus]|uniref:Ribonuclease H-like domain-containing protein n=1 Tax=Cynara cardunculus var. scolymus TaxID=59895 RepID=A0A103Y0P8_CYNCS|nr:Ribonuclease H-like domain-containing protein [Cynara cardunculus var. scolymus]
MESAKSDLIPQSSTVDPCSDWDLPFTDEELQSIEDVFESAASSSSSSRKSGADCDGDRPRTRRRLPDSLFNFGEQSTLLSDKSSSECNPIGASSSFSLLPCRTNRFSSPCGSSYRDKLKMRYPAMSFKGHIVYSRTFSEVEKAANELLTFVETKNRDGGHAVFGFDIEWRPTFKKGVKQGKAAVLQICAGAARCHVMHIIHSGFPENLKSLLRDPRSVKVIELVNFTCYFCPDYYAIIASHQKMFMCPLPNEQVGVGIAGDARKIFNDHNASVEALEDLSSLANQKLGGEPKSWGLASLTETLTCKQVLNSLPDAKIHTNEVVEAMAAS